MAFPVFTDTKNTGLLAIFGLPDSTFTGAANVGFQTAKGVAVGAAFSSSKVTSGDLVNIVPEPGSMVLFGSALLWLGCLVRKRMHS